MFIGVDESTLKRIDHWIGYNYYNLEVRDIHFKIAKSERLEKSQSNPFKKLMS
jgi:hypothetical protein